MSFEEKEPTEPDVVSEQVTCPKNIGKGCWVGDGKKPIYTATITGIVKHPCLPAKYYEIRTSEGSECIDPAFVIVNNIERNKK